jgi:hypothetical protein
MQFDGSFVLEGEYPVQFGIATFIDEGGWPLCAEALESLRGTGQAIRVSGQLIPDTNGCQIQVSKLEVESH